MIKPDDWERGRWVRVGVEPRPPASARRGVCCLYFFIVILENIDIKPGKHENLKYFLVTFYVLRRKHATFKLEREK